MHVKGTSNVVADVLSRSSYGPVEPMDPTQSMFPEFILNVSVTIEFDGVGLKQRCDRTFSGLIDRLENPKTGPSN